MKILIGSELELQTLLLNAKKEVFDDLIKEEIICDDIKCGEPCCVSYRKLKKHHLSTHNSPKQR